MPRGISKRQLQHSFSRRLYLNSQFNSCSRKFHKWRYWTAPPPTLIVFQDFYFRGLAVLSRNSQNINASKNPIYSIYQTWQRRKRHIVNNYWELCWEQRAFKLALANASRHVLLRSKVLEYPDRKTFAMWKIARIGWGKHQKAWEQEIRQEHNLGLRPLPVQ